MFTTLQETDLVLHNFQNPRQTDLFLYNYIKL